MLEDQELQDLIDDAIRRSGEAGVDERVTTTTEFIGWTNGLGLFMYSWWTWLFAIIVVVAQWKIFEKAGKPGWAAMIPIYNVIVLLELANRPWWWLLLMLIPFVGLVFGILATHQISKAFGKDGWFTLGLVVLPFVFYPILAFSTDTYHKPA